MIFKIILGVVMVTISTLIGYKLSDKKRVKKQIYCDLLTLTVNLKNQVNFTKNTLESVFNNLSPSLVQLINVNSKQFIEGDAVLVSDKRFSIEEREEIEMFFNGLGGCDVQGTTNLVDFYYEIFTKRYREYETIYKKTYSFYLKLGALCGVLLYIIVV